MAPLPINYAQVLQTVGCSVKSLPAQTECPFCGKTSFRLCEVDGVPWGSCMSCGFGGDVVEVYAHHKGFSHLSEALEDLRGAGAVAGNISKTNENEYINSRSHIQGLRDLRDRFRKSLRENISQSGGELLHQYGLYYGAIQQADAYVMRRTGLLASRDILLGGFGLRRVVHSEQSRHAQNVPALTIPYMVGYGLVSGFELFCRAGSVFMKSTEASCDGLAFLDDIAPGTKTVYAFRDTVSALHMHMQHLELSRSTAPAVAYSRDTTRAWDALSPSTVVLVDPFGEIEDVLSHAVRIPGCQIAVGLNRVFETQEDFHEFLRTTSFRAVSATLNRAVVAWERVLVDTLLNRPDHAYSIVNAMEITEDTVASIEDACSEREWSAISYLFKGKRAVHRQVTVGSKVLLECADGYWEAKSESLVKRQRVSNFILSLERVVRVRSTSATYYQGSVHIQGFRVPFFEDSKTISSPTSFSAWLEGHLLDSGVTVLPVVSKSWRAMLVDAVKMLNPPAVTLACERVAWDDDTIYFPNFSYSPETDTVTLTQMNLMGKGTPFSDVVPPISITLHDVSAAISGPGAVQARLPHLVVAMVAGFCAERFGWDAPIVNITGNQRVLRDLVKGRILEKDPAPDKEGSSFPPMLTVCPDTFSRGMFLTLDRAWSLAQTLREETIQLHIPDQAQAAKHAISVLQSFVPAFVMWASNRIVASGYADAESGISQIWDLLVEYLHTVYGQTLPRDYYHIFEFDRDTDYRHVLLELSDEVSAYTSRFFLKGEYLPQKAKGVLAGFGIGKEHLFRIASRATRKPAEEKSA